MALLTNVANVVLLTLCPGNKKDNVTIIYTPWSNLKKDGSMDVGQVSFHDPRKASPPPTHFLSSPWLCETSSPS